MASAPRTIDVMLVSLGSTPGLRVADRELASALERAGVRVAVIDTPAPREVRTLMLTDLFWARAARRALAHRLAQLGPRQPRAVIYSSTTAALLWPLPGAIRFDSPASANRPGRHGLWQRPLERRRLLQASLLLPWSEGGLAEADAAVPGCAQRGLILPAPIELTESHGDVAGRDVAAITYAGNPSKKGFDRVLAAWRVARRPGERLLVVGVTRELLHEAGFELPDRDIELGGSIPQSQLRGLLRRARVFICAPRREDYGLIQLEALAEGCQLVTTASPGPYVALEIARQLDPRLVGEDLAHALRVALDTPVADYAERAADLVEPFGRAALDRRITAQLLPRLGIS
ncbi:MAG TPA: glycosyltransferase [Solirubrobacteraceae bacterium]|jgi:glycosyltransferase involved in cell wall biosynthesis